jgi:signal transduction histidine kinase
VWRHVGVDLDEVTEHEIATLDLANPPLSGGMARLLERMKELDSQNEPIAIRRPNVPQIFGHVHYGISPLVTQLKLFPLVELALVATFGLLALLGYRSIKDSEQRSVWVGMAKETAHQLGTPISSLMGWLELLRERGGNPPGTQVMIESAFFDDVVSEMENDVARLEKIAARFSNVGSAPKLQQQDVVPVVGEAIQYLTRRPHMSSKIRVDEHLDEVPPVNINRELMEWVVENVLKNAMDAVDTNTGVITVEVRREPNTETVDIRVTDNGRGMTPAEQRRVFEPGYSTKRRGWGLGLSLCRRIVEEYHGGRILVERSSPGEGTTFVIQFPV